MFYGARWYDGSLGRFLSVDTIVPESSQGVQAWDRYAGMNNNPVRYNDPSGHGACDGPNADPECEGLKKPQNPTPLVLPGWSSAYIQKQPDKNACAPTAIAAALSTIMGGKVDAGQLDAVMEKGLWKMEAFGILPQFQDNAINSLAEGGLGNFSAAFQQGNRNDLLNNLVNGLPTIVNVSWGLTNGVGHALLVTSYDPSIKEFGFFDPYAGTNGSVITESQFNQQYNVTFDQAWLNQPNIFIPSGSMVTITP